MDEYLSPFVANVFLCNFSLLRATKGAHNPNLNIAITNALQLFDFCFISGLPLRMYGMQRTQCDHKRFDHVKLQWSNSVV